MPENQKQKVVVVIGPTASGKSGLGIFLAKKFDSEIISADSRQVYRGMDIGTGKVSKKEQRLAKHHLLDVANPKEVFTVSDFKKLGQRAVFDIASRNKVPFVVGGTGFYVDALIYDLVLPEVPPNKKLRAHLDRLGTELLFEKLKKLDPRRAKTIDPKNKRRLVRALEIIEAKGKVPTLNTKYEKLDTKYDILWLGLKPKKLEKRIKERLDKRLKQGMIKEVKRLLSRGVSKKRLNDFGLEYRQISEYLASKKFKVKSVKSFRNSEYYEKLLKEIIKYSKRQMTWFKRNKEIHWVKNQKEAEKIIRKFLVSHP